ncbi:polymeric immunoglobulin receptor-like [Limosa lapponica baueri]|nr:polymeric immunoglobulin receptor-like [Limosa lapponica baueri]
MGTVAESASTLLPTAPPGTSGTSPGEIYHERVFNTFHLKYREIPTPNCAAGNDTHTGAIHPPRNCRGTDWLYIESPVFGPQQVYGLLKGSVTVKCFYPPTSVNRHDRKYWCKESSTGCTTIVSTSGYTAPGFQGRVSIIDYPLAKNFQINMTELTEADQGTYKCGIGINGRGLSHKVSLDVSEESKVPQGKPTIFGVKGSSVTFECNYDLLRRSSVKYWCKWRDNGCAKIIENTGFVSPLYEGRVAMYDNPQNNSYTIILNQLRDSDKGYYWCMTDKENEQQSSTELKIIDGQPGLQGKKQVEAQEGSRVDLTCSYPCKYYSYQKYWCKWNNTGCTPMPASDQRQTGMDVSCDTDNKTVILSFDSVAKTDQGWYWCGVKRNSLFGETMAVYLEVTGGILSEAEQKNV